MWYTETFDIDVYSLGTAEGAAVAILNAVKAWELDAQWGYAKSIAALRKIWFNKEADIIQEFILDDEYQHEQILNEIIRRIDPNVQAQQDKGRQVAETGKETDTESEETDTETEEETKSEDKEDEIITSF